MESAHPLHEHDGIISRIGFAAGCVLLAFSFGEMLARTAAFGQFAPSIWLAVGLLVVYSALVLACGMKKFWMVLGAGVLLVGCLLLFGHWRAWEAEREQLVVDMKHLHPQDYPREVRALPDDEAVAWAVSRELERPSDGSLMDSFAWRASHGTRQTIGRAAERRIVELRGTRVWLGYLFQASALLGAVLAVSALAWVQGDSGRRGMGLPGIDPARRDSC